MSNVISQPFVPREIWDREYSSVQAIPSSTREEPAKALVLFADLMGLANGKRVLDAGCGNGRNAIYLAKRGCEITAVDFSSEAVKETQRRATEAGIEKKINVIERFIDDPLPFPEHSFDAVLDCYTFCHFLDSNLGLRFWREAERLINSNGQLFSIVFSPEDAYYAQFAPQEHDDQLIITDPSNGVSKRLYSEEQIKHYFERIFRYQFFSKFEFFDIVHGQQFKRVVLVSVLKKL
jgi:cyclopropane fatty-acyl-phospholipid synthase-like methyltransferase